MFFNFGLVIFLSISIIFGCVKCQVESYPGIVEIKEIQPAGLKQTNDPPDSQKFYVKYEFTVDQGADLGKVHEGTRLIKDSILLTGLQIKQKEIKVGAKFQAAAAFLTSGTCSPKPLVEDIEKWK